MGCSSVVSDIVKGFFITQQIPIDVEVVNDYDTEWFVNDRDLTHEKTLVFIVCYSGWSVEPCLFYERMKRLNGARNLIVLSGGGRIAKLAKDDGNSVIEYRMKHADREYPLYHVQQFFSIFLDLFHKLNILKSSYEGELKDAVAYLKKTFNESTVERARAMAETLQGSRIALLSTSKWYVQLLTSSLARNTEQLSFAGIGLYSATKAALGRLASIQRREFGLRSPRLTVTQVHPGIVDTTMQHDLRCSRGLDPAFAIKTAGLPPYQEGDWDFDAPAGKLRTIPATFAAEFIDWISRVPDSALSHEYDFYSCAPFHDARRRRVTPNIPGHTQSV